MEFYRKSPPLEKLSVEAHLCPGKHSYAHFGEFSASFEGKHWRKSTNEGAITGEKLTNDTGRSMLAILQMVNTDFIYRSSNIYFLEQFL
jgi:hypothetical protein